MVFRVNVLAGEPCAAQRRKSLAMRPSARTIARFFGKVASHQRSRSASERDCLRKNYAVARLDRETCGRFPD